MEQLKYNQWKNDNNVIEWFENISNKKNCAFTKFHVTEFYPSITGEILDTAITFAKNHFDVNNVELRTIKYYRKFLFFRNNKTWKNNTCFDVTMWQLQRC